MSKTLDLEAVLPAILQTAAAYRTACDTFEQKVSEVKGILEQAQRAIDEAVKQGRELGLDIRDPFDVPDPVDRAFNTIRLSRQPITLSCQI